MSVKVVVNVSRGRKEFVEVKEFTIECHQRTNDTVYIKEFVEIIEPREVVSRVKKTVGQARNSEEQPRRE